MQLAKALFIAVLLMLAIAPAAALGADKLADVQKAVDEAEKKLQRAIDIDPRVMAARRRVDQTQATLDRSINLGEAALKLATQHYQEAQVALEAAERAAAPKERALLDQRRKELLAIKETPPTTSPTSQKPDGSAPADDAATIQRTGDVSVRLIRARIAPVAYTPTGSTQVRPSEPLFGLLVEVKNLGKQPVEYIGWNTNAFATDAAEKQYLPAGVPGGTVLGRVVSASLPPNASIEDLIVLQTPPEHKDLTITLPAFNLGGSGAVQFHLAADKLEISKDPLVTSKTPTPPVVLAPVPKPTPSSASKPTTQVAGKPGEWGRSADGVDFPPVTDPDAKKDRAHAVSRLPDVCGLLMYPPAKLNFPVFSVDKSSAKLKEPMSRIVPVPGNRAHNVTRAERVEQDQLDPACQFFALNICNASVAGFEIRNGVVARIVLYYKRTDSAQRMLLVSYGQAPQPNSAPKGLAVEVGPWTCKNANSGNTHDPTLNRDIWPILPQESPATLQIDTAAMNEYKKP